MLQRDLHYFFLRTETSDNDSCESSNCEYRFSSRCLFFLLAAADFERELTLDRLGQRSRNMRSLTRSFAMIDSPQIAFARSPMIRDESPQQG